ncbi:MAG: NUDIX domain-containing protein [Anaerolineaceae bacterium]|nr:NUDIX domain-containing protein [Anaerolineaceae bacterium]
MIECVTHYGQTRLVPKEKLTFRPSAYAIIPWQGKVLLVNTSHTGTYSLPGGGIEPGERIEDALRREVREETGIEIEVGKFIDFQEHFFYYDPLDSAFHSFMFYYLCRPITIDLCRDEQVEDDAVEKPRWVEIEGLKEEQFHNHGRLILDAIHKYP